MGRLFTLSVTDIIELNHGIISHRSLSYPCSTRSLATTWISGEDDVCYEAPTPLGTDLVPVIVAATPGVFSAV